MPDSALSKDDLFALRNELVLAEKYVATTLDRKITEGIERYTGLHLPSIASDWSIILNEIYPVIQYNLPAIFFRNPQVYLLPRNKFYFAKKRDPVTGKLEEVQLDSTESAKTQESILNYTLQQIRYKHEIRKVLLDALLFPHGVLWHGYKGDFGMTQEKSLYIEDDQVYVQRLSPVHFLHDLTVSIENLDQARWVARVLFIRMIDLYEDDTLNVDKSRLKGIVGYGEKVNEATALAGAAANGKDTIQLGGSRMRELIEYSEKGFKDLPHARFVKCYEVWRRPTPKEKRNGEKGKVILLTFEQPKELRTSIWPYNVPGFPGQVLQFNPVPDKKYGISDLDVYGSIADHKNLVINQQIRNAEQTNRTLVGINKDKLADEEDVEKIRRGENNVVAFDLGDNQSISNNIAVMNMGAGSSNELYSLDQRIDKNLQDKSGVSDLKRGFVQSGEESATSIRQRSAGGAARPAYRQDLMADFLKGSCHYLNELLKQYMPIEDAVRLVGSLDIQWSNVPSKEDLQAEVDVELDVQSMTPENPELEIQQLTTILNMMIEAINTPSLYQKIQEEGKTFNISPVIEQLLMRLKIRNPDIFRNINQKESMGYAPVAELKAAQANVNAVLTNQAPPSPPAPGQDHKTRLEVYGAIAQLIQQAGAISDGLNQLIQVQAALLQAEEEKQGNSGQVVPQGRMKRPSLNGQPVMSGR